MGQWTYARVGRSEHNSERQRREFLAADRERIFEERKFTCSKPLR